jgi:hypothetical protein
MIGLLTIGLIGLALCKKRGIEKISGISGLKHYYIQYGVGKARYLVNYTDGNKKHRDGSRFYDTAIFSNKSEMDKFLRELKRDGYVATYRSLLGLAELEKWFLKDVDYIELEPIDENLVYANIWEKYAGGHTVTIDYETANDLIRLYNATWV